jgi:hypothetical protein
MAVELAGGRMVNVDPAADVGRFTLPPGSPGALQLQGPREALLNPPKTIPAGRQVIPLPPRPGVPGRLVRRADGTLAVTPWSLPRAVGQAAPVPYTDPPMGANAAIQGLPDGSVVVLPLAMVGFPGADDSGPINEALLRLPTYTDPETGIVYQRGRVLLAAASYNIQAGIVKPPMADLAGQGAGTRLNVSGAAVTGIYSHFGPGGGSQQRKGGTIRDLLIDGTNATGASTGIDIGDGWGHSLERVWIQNFGGAGAIGLAVVNRQSFTEKFTARQVHLIMNSTAAYHFTVVSVISQEYQDLQYYIWAPNNANGVTFQGLNWNGRLEINGNIGQDTNPNTNWMLGFLSDVAGNGGGPTTFNGEVCANWEVNPMQLPGGSPPPYSLYFGPAVTGGASTFVGAGFLRRGGGNTCVTNAVAGQIQFRGKIVDSSGTPQAVFDPAVTPGQPVSGTVYTNSGNDALVSVAGGTVSQIQVAGQTSGQTSGQLLVPAGATIKVTWSVQPAWSWTPAQP